MKLVWHARNEREASPVGEIVHPYLMPALELGPHSIKRLLVKVPGDQIDVPTGEGRFTPREVIAHLADWETVFLQRMQSAKSCPLATVDVYDEAEWAIEHAYGATDPLAQADLFLQRRRQTIDWLSALGQDDWKLAFTHPERGMMTIEDQANMLVGHDQYHVEQLTEVLEDA